MSSLVTHGWERALTMAMRPDGQAAFLDVFVAAGG